jgi:integrase
MMPVYNRARPGQKPVLWISYPLTNELRQRYGISARVVREAAGTGDRRQAKAFEAQRRREVADGTWSPKSVRSIRGSTVAQYGEAWLALRKDQGVKRVDIEELFLRLHVFPRIGYRKMVDVKREDLIELVGSLQKVISIRTKKPLAPRTIRGIYSTLKAMFDHAFEVDELLDRNPCTLRTKRGELPVKDDADIEWRDSAVYDRDEVVALLSDERLSMARRVFYALLFLTGMRIGEAIGRRWRDYDAGARPLGRLFVATQYAGEAVKTRKPRAIPVHETLANVLASWRTSGWPRVYGRAPTRDDYIVPRQVPDARGAVRHQSYRRSYNNLRADLAKIGLRPRRVHDTRRTFVSLARMDGASELLQWVTHTPSKSRMQDLYTSPTWASLCEQVAKLNLTLPAPGHVIELPVGRPPKNR